VFGNGLRHLLPLQCSAQTRNQVRILFVTPFYAPEWKFGGPPRKISSLAKELVRRGHDVRVVTFHSERPNDRDKHIVDSINVQYLPWFGVGLRQCPRTLRPLRDEIESASIVHCYGLYNLICPMAALVALRCSTPFLIEPMGMYVPRVRRFFLKRIYNLLVTRWLFRKAAAVIATSELEALELRNSDVPAKILIRGNGVTLDDLPDSDTSLRLREKWGVSRDDQFIGYIGRISKKKGLLELVKAFNSVTSPETKLLIAGPVSEAGYLQQLQQTIRASARRGDIIMRGLLIGDDYVAALRALDLFVLPSENENFGNSAAEAVLASVPVLLTRDCGVASIIDGRVGMAVDYGIDGLLQGLEIMLKPETRPRWTPHWEEVKAELSWEEPVRVMEEIYKGMLREREKLKSGNAES
jgi:glycosyltransferase involved in cell wall biosynthesis